MSDTVATAAMPLSDFMRKRASYVAKAQARVVERLNLQLADTPHAIHVVEEILMDVLERLEAIESMLGSEPEPSKPKK